jgi:HEAT repeat protein
MKARWLACLFALCAVRANGDTVVVSAHMVSVLTAIDDLPPKATLAEAFTVDSLRAILETPKPRDLALQLRAIHALPQVCALACSAASVTHTVLRQIVDGPNTAPDDLLRVRAAVDALAVLATGDHTDVMSIISLLGHTSRDVRTSAVRALRALSDCSAKPPLMQLLKHESSKQVQLAVNAALSAFEQCH